MDDQVVEKAKAMVTDVIVKTLEEVLGAMEEFKMDAAQTKEYIKSLIVGLKKI
jgi:hypothetical protein